ncbi:MAG: hypothetical protein V4611_02740 [Patescibacteria group bacterium]
MKPVVEHFPHDCESLVQLFVAYRRAFVEFGEVCSRSLDETGSTAQELVEARERLASYKVNFTLRYPDLGRVRGDTEGLLPDQIEEVSLTPHSLMINAGQRTVYEFVGATDRRVFAIQVAEDGSAKVDITTNYN